MSDGVNVNISSAVLGGWKLEYTVGKVVSIVIVDVTVDVKIPSVLIFSSCAVDGVESSSFLDDCVNSSVDVGGNDVEVDLNIPSDVPSLELAIVVSVLDMLISPVVLLPLLLISLSMSLVECCEVNDSIVVVPDVCSSTAVVMRLDCVIPEISVPAVEEELGV